MARVFFACIFALGWGLSGLAEPATHDVRILRDSWGVPHIFGQSDADCAFGLAYAHAEDDYKTIEEALLVSRGESAAYFGKGSAVFDYMVRLLDIQAIVDAHYDTDLSSDTRALVEAYAEGLTLYAERHPKAVVSKRILPFTGKDVIAGFVFRGPFFFGLDNAIKDLFTDGPRSEAPAKNVGTAQNESPSGGYLYPGEAYGSNTFAVGPARTPDGSTYLNVNSHQPWTGPVAWYEAHVHSEEGWDMVGGVFPGAPVILHGHNRHLGWAHTVNHPDLIDIYTLEVNPDDTDQYLFDGVPRAFGHEKTRIKVKIAPFLKWPVKRDLWTSVHGPVVRTDHGDYAIRYAGRGDVRQVEQWYRMNKATNMAEWMEAVRMRANASLNIGYADAEGNIAYIYNALWPKRADGYDWQGYLPGNTSETLWDAQDYWPFDGMPMVINPPSAFIQNCNSTPFNTTVGQGNPDPRLFPASLGIETRMTNRALRANALLSADDQISWDDFYTIKYDVRYDEESYVGQCIQAIRAAGPRDDPFLGEAMALLSGWDRQCTPESRAAALAVLTLQPLFQKSKVVPPTHELLYALRETAIRVKDVFGRIDPEWLEVNQMHRGEFVHGLGGGPDLLHAVAGPISEDGAHIVPNAGDCYVLLVRWDGNGQVSSKSIHQFGSATVDATSPHYADQARLFVETKMKDVWMDEAAIRAHLEREYRPGEE